MVRDNEKNLTLTIRSCYPVPVNMIEKGNEYENRKIGLG